MEENAHTLNIPRTEVHVGRLLSIYLRSKFIFVETDDENEQSALVTVVMSKFELTAPPVQCPLA